MYVTTLQKSERENRQNLIIYLAHVPQISTCHLYICVCVCVHTYINMSLIYIYVCVCVCVCVYLTYRTSQVALRVKN